MNVADDRLEKSREYSRKSSKCLNTKNGFRRARGRMTDIAGLGGPFVLLLLFTFGALLAVLGAFLLVWARGKPRIFGTGFLLVGVIVVVATLLVVSNGDPQSGINILMDALLPAVIYLLAVAIGAVLAILPFLVAAVRS